MKQDAGIVVLCLIVGAVIGGLLGELLGGVQMLTSVTPYLTKSVTIFDVPPVTINLYIIQFVVGLSLHPNLISILGALFAFFLLRRL